MRLRLLRKSITSRSVSTRSSRASRGVMGTVVDLLRRKGDADGDDRLHRAQRRERHVVIAGAVADAVAAAVEGQQRHDQDIGIDLGRVVGFGSRMPQTPDAAARRTPRRA